MFRSAYWRLVSVLQVVRRFDNHEDAAEWHRDQGLRLPTNCIIEGNPPVALDRTDGWHRSLDASDRIYHRKARLCPVFLACRPRELNDPPIITEEIMIGSFGHAPAPRTPPVVPLEAVQRLISETELEARLTQERI